MPDKQLEAYQSSLGEQQLILRNCYFTADAAHSVHICVIEKCESTKNAQK